MPLITFYDGTSRLYRHSISILDLSKDISFNSEKYCIFGYVNHVSVDKHFIIKRDSLVKIIYQTDKLALDSIRNTCSYLLGKAVKELWPDSKISENCILENGFYCDIDVNFSFKEKDLDILEFHMRKIVYREYIIDVKKVSKQEACNIFEISNEIYKVFVLKKLDSLSNNLVSLCFHEGYVDIQNGISVPNISFCQNFKLQKFSGVYWNNDEKNRVLQRIYGTAWITEKELKDFLKNYDILEKRDHRKISKELDLYHIQEDLPGMIFWHNHGLVIFRKLKDFMRIKLEEYNYQEVKTPLMMNKKLWKDSGHLDNYKKSMFMVTSGNFQYGLKPMNCPGHVKIFSNSLRSYRDLPIRISEFGSCHRNEPSGSLHGLMRIRNFTQDDAHIFCREDQICSEVSNCIKMVYDVYKVFGFSKILVKLSTRPKFRIGNDILWSKAEHDLEKSLRDNSIVFEYQHGEGAFYGPKIELSLSDSLGRIWQCATIQLDFYLPKNLNAFYIDSDNIKKFPIVVHRAILGSIERFIGILIEEYSGNFPTWLAPIQVILTSIRDSNFEYLRMLYKEFYVEGIRAELDLRNEKISFKIREYSIRKIPYIIICGDKEVNSNTITLRTRSGKNFSCIKLQYFIRKIKQEIHNYSYKQMEE